MISGLPEVVERSEIGWSVCEEQVIIHLKKKSSEVAVSFMVLVIINSVKSSISHFLKNLF